MKTATVRDLRNHFADVAKWIEEGEPVWPKSHPSAKKQPNVKPMLFGRR